MTVKDIVLSLPQSVIKKQNLITDIDKYIYVLNNLSVYKPDSVEVYHGSYEKIVEPLFGFGKDYNDYGKGFYTTLDIEKAKEWAHTQELISGYVHKIELDISDLSIFNFDKYPTYVWLTELMSYRVDLIESKNRNDIQTFISKYSVDKQFDLYLDWRADASFYTILELFIDNTIPYEMIDTYLHYGNQGYQLFLKSQKAFNSIKQVTNLGTVEHKYFDLYTRNLGNAIDKIYTKLKAMIQFQATLRLIRW